MAAFSDESYLDLCDFDLELLIKLQAFWRGFLVRKKIKDTQREFVDIVNELDESSMTVEWKPPWSLNPTVIRVTRKQKAARNRQIPVTGDRPQSKCHEQDAAGKDCHKLVQTSFIGMWSKTDSDCRSHSYEANCQRPGLMKDQSSKTAEEKEVDKEIASTCSNDKLKEQIICDSEKLIDSTVKECDKKGSVNEGDKLSKPDDHLESSPRNKMLLNKTVAGACDEQQTLNSNSGTSCVTSSDCVKTPPVTSSSEHKPLNTEDPHSNDEPERSHVFCSDILTDAAARMGCSMQTVGGVSSQSEEKKNNKVRIVDSFYGDQTSVWDSSSSIARVKERKRDDELQQNACPDELGESVPGDIKLLSTDDLVKLRQHVAMELLWVQQAIISRKEYLKVKIQMEAGS